MSIIASLLNFDHGDGDVRTVIRNSLIIVKKIRKHKSHFDCTFSGLQTGYMTCLDFGYQAVDNLLERLDGRSLFNVVCAEGIVGEVEYLN